MKKYLLFFLSVFLFSNLVLSQQLSFERLYSDSFKSEFYLTLDAQYVKGDLDNDGDIDLILNGTVGGNPRTTVYFNDGLDNFNIAGSLNGVFQGSLELGDVDGDGDLDCILSGRTVFQYYETVLMLNDGNGNFSHSQVSLPPMRFSSTILGDVDGDNDLDLFITGEGWNGKIHTELYLNDGLGAFSIDSNNAFIQLQRSDAVFFDIDNDSDLDLVYAGENSSGLKNTNVYLNNGLGDFTIDYTNTFIGTSFPKLKLADIDNDGDKDLWMLGYVGQGSASQIMLYINNGSGLLKLDSVNIFPNIDRASITLFDLNNDNQLDIIFTGSLNNVSTTQIFNNKGNGQFAKDTMNNLRNVQNGSVIPLDLNNDSFEDLVLFGNQTGFGSPISSIYLNDQNGRFNIRAPSNIIIPLLYGVTIHADIDGDQDEDLFMTGMDIDGNPRSLLYKNDGSGNFQLNSSPIIGTYDGESVFTDIDQDSDVDLVVSGKDNNDILITKIYLNDGLGNFIEDTINKLQGVYQSSIVVSDFNNDGQQDLVVAGSLSSRVSSTNLYFGNNGIFILDSTYQIKNLGFGSISVADIDNDNDLDLFISGEGLDPSSIWNWGSFSFIYENDGSGGFTKSTKRPLFEQVSRGNSEFADIDNDGDYDLIYSGSGTNVATGTNVYLNDGLGDFRRSIDFNTLYSNYSQILTDLDNDNDLDIITYGNSISTIHLNDSLGYFSIFQNQYLTSFQGGSSTYFDIDGDNDIDLLFIGVSLFSSHSVFIYRNELISKVGIEERKVATEYKLVPNPTNGVVDITDDYQEIKSVEVYSINGQLIFSNELTQSLSHQINLPDQNGIYILLIHAKDGQSAQRVVKY
ncbi:T9SS type A sorting domain-containing protein [bacterium]|nr:T9SS type A sorting domain-containing protein [bacterium]